MKRGKRMFHKDKLRIVLHGEEAENYLKVRGDIEFFLNESERLQKRSEDIKSKIKKLEQLVQE